MAERRMFAKSVTYSDAFMALPFGAQALYFHLMAAADDDGFVNNKKLVERAVGSTEEDFSALVAGEFVLVFTESLVVIRHWRVHNHIQRDRYKETVYTDQRAMLASDGQNAYVRVAAPDPSTEKSPPADSRVQPSVGEKREEPKEKKSAETGEKKRAFGIYGNVFFGQTELEGLKREFPDLDKRIDRLSEYMQSKGASYHDHAATIRAWARQDREKETAGAVAGGVSRRQGAAEISSFDAEEFFAAALASTYGETVSLPS